MLLIGVLNDVRAERVAALWMMVAMLAVWAVQVAWSAPWMRNFHSAQPRAGVVQRHLPQDAVLPDVSAERRAWIAAEVSIPSSMGADYLNSYTGWGFGF